MFIGLLGSIGALLGFRGLGFNSVAAAAEEPSFPSELIRHRQRRSVQPFWRRGRRSNSRPHIGANDITRSERRRMADIRAAEMNYRGWCGLDYSGAAHDMGSKTALAS